MQVNSSKLFSYACDDFVVNDTPDAKLDRLRAALLELKESKSLNNAVTTPTIKKQESSATPSSEEPSRRSSLRLKKSAKRRSPSVDGVNGVENQPANKKARKSTDSNSKSSSAPQTPASKSNSKKDALKNLVGLRNLGNTCFMSAVLQSLG